MTPKIIISYDGTIYDDDALALGRVFADAGATVALAYVRHTHEDEAGREQLAQHEAEALLERGAESIGKPDAERHVILNASTPEGLATLAEQVGAELVVFGSDYRTAPGLVVPGVSAQRLLDGGPVAVAIAPAGMRHRSGIEIIAVTGDDDNSAQETAATLAAGIGARVVETDDDADLVVIGSIADAPKGRVLISSASAYKIETATSPVLVVPHGTPVSFGAPVSLASS